MLRKLRRRLTYANVTATLALFFALGGSAYAAFVVTSNSQIGPDTIYGASKPASANDNVVAGSIAGTDIAPSSVGTNKIIDNSIGATDLGFNSVGSGKVIDNSLTGTDINESTLAGVDAASVGGVKAVKFRYARNADVPMHPEEMLNLGGLVLTAECRSFGDGLDVKARTTKDDASVYLASTSTGDPNDTDGLRDTDGADFTDGHFNTSDVLEVDNNFQYFGQGIGTLIYEAPDQNVAVVHFSLNELPGPTGCVMAGVAIGG